MSDQEGETSATSENAQSNPTEFIYGEVGDAVESDKNMPDSDSSSPGKDPHRDDNTSSSSSSSSEDGGVEFHIKQEDDEGKNATTESKIETGVASDDAKTIRMLAAIFAYFPPLLGGFVVYLVGRFGWKDHFLSSNGAQGLLLGLSFLLPFGFMVLLWASSFIAFIPIIGLLIILFVLLCLALSVLHVIACMIVSVLCIVMNFQRASGDEVFVEPFIFPLCCWVRCMNTKNAVSVKGQEITLVG